MPMKSLFSQCVDPSRARAMDEDEQKFMLKLLIAEQAQLFKPSKAADLFKNSPETPPFIIQVMIKRLQLAEADLEYSEGTLMLLASIATSPAQAVMLSHELVMATLKHGQYVTLTYLTHDLIPWGFPTEEMFKEAWQSQKITREPGHSDNWLDTAEAWHG